MSVLSYFAGYMCINAGNTIMIKDVTIHFDNAIWSGQKMLGASHGFRVQ